jgi:hypothetical protein
MVFNATFNNISVISWQSVLLVEETVGTWRKPSTCCKKLTKFIKYTSPWVGFKFTRLVVIGTDCTGSCKSNYHTITTTTASLIISKSAIKSFVMQSISNIRKYLIHIKYIRLIFYTNNFYNRTLKLF